MKHTRSRSPRTLRCLWAAVALSAGSLGAQSSGLPTAEQLMARHDSAVGGRHAFDKYQSIHQTGTFALPAMGLQAPMNLYRAKPDRYLFRVELGEMGDIMFGNNGTTIWSIQPQQPATVVVGEMAEMMKAQMQFFGGLHDVRSYREAVTVELGDLNGQPSYKVRLVSLTGAESFEYFDATTGLSAGVRSWVDGPSGKLEHLVTTTAYKEFGGILFPTKEVTTTILFESVVEITAVEFDRVDPETFALPPAVKALVKP